MPVIGQYAPLGLKPLFFTASIKTLGISPATMNVAPGYFNPLSPKSDQHQISPYNINAL